MAQPSAFKPSLPQVSGLFLERGRGTSSPKLLSQISWGRGFQGAAEQVWVLEVRHLMEPWGSPVVRSTRGWC